MLATVKGGVGAFAREVTAEALLIGADYAEDTGADNAEQLRALGAAMLASPDVSERAARQAKTKGTVRALLRAARRIMRARYAAGGLRAGWFTDARIAWKGLTARDRAFLGSQAEGGGIGVNVREVIPAPEEGEPLVFGSIDPNDKPTRGEPYISAIGPDGQERGRLALWRVLLLVKRFPGALWRWRGDCEPAALVQGGEVVAVLMPMTRW
jgi:hypothetical protein